MKQITKQKSVEMLRCYQVLLLRSWRSVLYYHSDIEDEVSCFSELKKVHNSDMALMVGITPCNFSRLINGVYTVSSPVLVQIYSAMCRSLGRDKFLQIRSSCLSTVHDRFIGNE